MQLQLIVCAFLVTSCFCAEIPKSLKKCDRKASDFGKCLAAAVEDALIKSAQPVREIGLQKLEPLEIPALTIGAGTGAVAFVQNYKPIKVSGFSKIKCSKADMDFVVKTLTIECDTPVALLEFQYEVNGKILLLPIYGKGPGSIEFDDLNVKGIFTFEEYEKSGKKHFKVASNKFVFTPKLVKFKLENLFDGDKALGDNINKVLNENWSEVLADVKPNYEEAFGQIFSSIFDHVLSKVSVTELFGDE